MQFTLVRERKYVRKCLRRRSLGDVREGREYVREEARERSRGGPEGTFVRDEGTFARGDLQGHRMYLHSAWL